MKPDKELCNVIYRVRDSKAYYFDENGIWRQISCEEAVAKKMKNIRLWKNDKYTIISVPQTLEGISDGRIIKSSFSKLEIGDDYSKFIDILHNAKLKRRSFPSGLDLFITKIDMPYIYRKTGNDNLKTFDFIRVDVFFLSNWDSDTTEYIQNNKKEIFSRVIAKIESCRNFRKYGIPINFLRCSSIKLNKSTHSLIFYFELKELSQDNSNKKFTDESR